MSRVIAVIGGGFMGEALISGLLIDQENRVVVAEKSAARADYIRDSYGVAIADPEDAVAEANVVMVVVKPADVPAVLKGISPHLDSDATVVSLAAGVTLSTLSANLPEGTPVVRVMPNTPALVAEGMCAMSPSSECSDEARREVATLLRGLGKVVEVPESQQDAVTAVSGSGPAYVFAFVEALIDGGVLVGLPRATARELAIQTLVGSAALLKETGEHPAILRENVTSPGGTTAAALRQLEDKGFASAVLAAVEAARNRSRELSGQ